MTFAVAALSFADAPDYDKIRGILLRGGDIAALTSVMFDWEVRSCWLHRRKTAWRRFPGPFDE
jgi:hypothetical protein